MVSSESLNEIAKTFRKGYKVMNVIHTKKITKNTSKLVYLFNLFLLVLFIPSSYTNLLSLNLPATLFATNSRTKLMADWNTPTAVPKP